MSKIHALKVSTPRQAQKRLPGGDTPHKPSSGSQYSFSWSTTTLRDQCVATPASHESWSSWTFAMVEPVPSFGAARTCD